MAEIHVLDKHTAELIAAGEVVERPASVVKELLENSIDAGASQITVSIESGGVRLIEISDNGTGIEAKYIPTAFIRHATSKIRTEDDLTSIHTLGFRGEALASIASVARVEVLTRTEADECASLYRIEGGEEQPIEPGARGVGTTIRVCDLFFNTPARMKFLKKDSSEGTFVADIVGHVALSHPEVSFKFIREGKLQYVTPGDGQLRSAAYAVLGREFSRDLVEVDNREGVYRVWGLITQPRSCRASRSMQYFYINGRYVRNRTMMAGMEMAFKGTTMQGKFPGGILLLEMPADLVDVNVHPAKTEVRFARENDIFDLVYHAVKLALSQPGTGERQFVFDSEKENNVSNKYENSGNKEENDVKNNNFTGLSAVISGQAEPGSLPHPEEKPLRPAAPAASVTPRTTQPSAPERDILPLPVKAPEKAAQQATEELPPVVFASAPADPETLPKKPEKKSIFQMFGTAEDEKPAARKPEKEDTMSLPLLPLEQDGTPAAETAASVSAPAAAATPAQPETAPEAQAAAPAEETVPESTADKLHHMAAELTLRCVLAGILAVVLLHLGLTAERLLPPLSVLDPDAAPAAFYAANLLLFAASLFVGYPVLRDGLTGLRGRPSADTMPALAAVAALLQAVVAMLNANAYRSTEGIGLLTGMAALGLFLALVGSRVMLAAVQGGYALAAEGGELRGAYRTRDKDLIRALARDLEQKDPWVLLSRPVQTASNDFVEQSLSERASERRARKVACILLAAAVLSCVAFLLFGGGLNGMAAAMATAASTALPPDFITSRPIWAPRGTEVQATAFLA